MADYYITEDIKALVRHVEDFSPTAYDDVTGHPTIGYGHLIKPDEKYLLNKVMTKEEAERLMVEDIKSHQEPWAKLLKPGTPDNVYLALTSLAFNVGPGSDAMPRAIERINKGDLAGAAEIISHYNKSKGKDGELVVLKGLVNRRGLEGNLIQNKTKFNAADFAAKRRLNNRSKLASAPSASPNMSSAAIDGANQSNADILVALKELNKDLKMLSEERAYLDRLRLEGSGLWAAQ